MRLSVRGCVVVVVVVVYNGIVLADLCVGFSSSKKALETFSSASPYEDDDADFEDKDASLSHNPSRLRRLHRPRRRATPTRRSIQRASSERTTTLLFLPSMMSLTLFLNDDSNRRLL